MQNLHFKYWPKDLPKNLEIPDQDIYTNLKNSSLKFPKKKCIIFENLEITYEQLDNYVNKLSFFLTDNLKIKKGDRILLDLQSSPTFYNFILCNFKKWMRCSSHKSNECKK